VLNVRFGLMTASPFFYLSIVFGLRPHRGAASLTELRPAFLPGARAELLIDELGISNPQELDVEAIA
jgi:hypothetical protein